MGRAPVQRGDRVGHVVVLEKLDDELPEFLVSRLLGHQQVSRGVHVRSVLAVGLPLTDCVQAQRDGRCDDGILHQELRIHRGGGCLRRCRDVVLEVENRLVEVIIFALFQLRLRIQP